MNARQKILNKNNEGKYVCVGLDTDIEKIPIHIRKQPDAVYKFNQAIIEATKEHAAAYKINFAFYERLGSRGMIELEKTIELIPDDVLSIADAKRGDIGNTSQMYAKSIFEHYNFDSVTLHPYMGRDSLQPFLDYSDKMNYILVLTSNPGAEDFEKLKLQDGRFVYEKILASVNEWNDRSNCGVVFGATKMEELKLRIKDFGNLSVLLPGVGAQGGSFSDVCTLFKQHKRQNYLVNVSRGIIYVSNGEDFSEAAKNEIISLNSLASKS